MFAVRVLLFAAVVLAGIAALAKGGVWSVDGSWELSGSVGCLAAALLVERKP